jgi:hypothetical protein
MPYTIACRHHKNGRHDRHPRQWDTWDDAARELAVFVENLVTRLSSPLNEPEMAHMQMLTAQITRSGIAVLPGLTTYQVVDVTDAPARDPARSDTPGRIDWPTVGRLARRAQRHTIDLNDTASVAATNGQDSAAADRARATLHELADLCIALHGHLSSAS